MEIVNIALEAGIDNRDCSPGDAGKPSLTVSMFTESMEQSLDIMNRLRALEAQLNANGVKADPKQPDLPGTSGTPHVTPASEDKPEEPKRGRGRPKMSDEEKAAKKAEREAKKKAEAEAKAAEEEAGEAAAAEEAEAQKAAAKAAAAEEAEADEDEDEDDVVVEEEDDAEDDVEPEEDDVEPEEDDGGAQWMDGASMQDLIKALQPLGKLRDVLTQLQSMGYKTSAQLVEVCEDIQADVPCLSRIKGLNARVARAASVMGID